MKVYRGNSLLEYALPLVVLTGVFILALSAVPQRLAIYMQDTMNSTQNGDSLAVKAYGNVPESVMDRYRPPARATVQMTLSNGEVITLENFPVNIPELVETNGGNGTTTLLANQLQTLAQQLLEEGVIDEAQGGYLKDLANQGHRFATLERLIEEAANDPDFDWNQDTITFDGREYYSTGLAYQLTNGNYTPGEFLNPDNLDGMIQGYDPAQPPDPRYPPAIELFKMADRYKQVRDSGALNEPVIRDVVDRLVDQIVMLGHDSNEARHAFANGQVSDIREGWYSAVTDNNAVDICSAGNGRSSGVRCQ